MAIVKTQEYKNYVSAVTLEQYATLTGYSECAMYGVYNPDTFVQDECRSIWTLEQRNYIQRYFQEAQIELENETNRLFSPTWITGNISDTGNDRLTDFQTCKNSYYTKWNRLIAMGRKQVINLQLSATVDHTVDPAKISIAVNPSVIKDINFVKVYYPNTEIEINPSNVFVIGSTLYIEIPRCRLVEFSLRNNDGSGLLYADITNFQTNVDVVYLTTQDVNSVMPCDYGVGLWYLAGEIVPTVQQTDMIIRLAHSKAPEMPCGCPIGQSAWVRDRNIPDILTQERLQCKFGLNDGAWIAWQWCQSMKILRIGHG